MSQEDNPKRHLWLASVSFLAWMFVAAGIFRALKEGGTIAGFPDRGGGSDISLLVVLASVMLLAVALRSLFMYFQASKDNNETSE